MLKIAIIEDHDLFRTSIEMALSQNPAFEMAWSMDSADRCFDLIENSKPDVLLMDIGLPHVSGIDITKKIKQQFPEIKVVMLTAQEDLKSVLDSINSGADAYCTKEISFDTLNQVIKMVADGAMWFDPAVAKFVYDFVKNYTPATDAAKFNLSEREIQVLKLMIEGKSNKEIAAELFITTHTVKAHVCNIIQKLSARDRTDASVKALKHGIC